MTLNEICDWNYRDNIAVEYRDLDKNIFINYAELHDAKETVSDYLANINQFEFIAIDSDVVEYCVPSLMLGIMASGHGFVNMPLEATVCNYLLDSLSVKYLLSQCMPSEGEVIAQFKIHDQCIRLIKLEEARVRNMQVRKKGLYAYAIATSGTTGRPKIVRVPNSSIVPNIQDLKRILEVKSFDKIAQLTSFTFDPCIVEIFLTFASAATLFMVSKLLKNNTNRLLEEIHSSDVTVLQLTPSVFMYNWSVERVKNTIFNYNSSLRVILFGGEPFPKIKLLFETKHPQNRTRIFNIYGITEVSCWASINEITDDTCINVHYLGEVLSETNFQVRNEVGEIIRKGEGSLYIGSNTRICVINDETFDNLTSPVFRDSGDMVNINEEGRIFYNGRKDRIIKRFGNKLDLQMLENVTLEVNFVKNCYALWHEESHKLHLCLTTMQNTTEYTKAKIQIMKHLEKLKPIYKPDDIHFFENFELTSSGKVSVEHLREKCTRDETGNITDSLDVERIFQGIWQLHLRSSNDGFVKLGGTSVAALQISNAISEALSTEFPELIGMLLRDATFDECLAYIKKNIVSKSEDKRFEYFQHFRPIDKHAVTLENEHVEAPIISNDTHSGTKHKNTYRWHKCRGKMYGDFTLLGENLKSTEENISNIQVLEAYDLKKCVDASPTVFQYDDGKSYASVGSHSGIICTVELKGKKGIPYEAKLPDRIEASVLVLDDFIGIVGCYDGNVYCLNLITGQIIWKYQTGDVVKCTAIFCEQRKRIFIGSYDCYVYCLSVEDGTEVWKMRGSNGSVSAAGCLHSYSNTVLFGTLDGTCLALQQTSGQIFWKSKLDDPIFVAPHTLSCGLVLFCSVAGALSCFDIDVNIEIWKYKINGNVFSYIVTRCDPITKCETVIVASQNKSVYFFEVTNATTKMEFSLKRVLNFHCSLYATPWCEDDFLLVACTDGTLSIHSILKEKSLKSIKLPGDVFSSPVIHENSIIVGCRDNNVYVLEYV